MKPGGVFRELYVLKKLLFCFIDSGFYLSVRIIELFRQLFVGSTIKQTAFQYGSVSFVEYPQIYQFNPFRSAEIEGVRSHNVLILPIDKYRTHR